MSNPLVLKNKDWLQALESTSSRLQFHCANLYQARPNFGQYQRHFSQHVLNFIIDTGALHVEYEQGAHVCKPGSAVWVNAWCRHNFSIGLNASLFRMINFRFTLTTDSGHDLIPEHHVLHSEQGDRLRPLFEATLREQQGDHPDKDQRLRRWLHLIYTDMQYDEDIQQRRGLSDLQRQQLYRYIQEHPSHRPSTAELAQVVHLSEDYFRRIFHHSFGRSPKRWLMEQRIAHASSLLLDGYNVSQCAEMLGYPNIYLFSRQFKIVKGVAPSRYSA